MWYRKRFWYRLFLYCLVGLFCLTVTAGFVLILVMPKPTESEAEKRTLAAMPTLSVETWFDGSFARDFELFISDTFPFRDNIVTLAASIDEWKGVRPDGVKIIDAPSTTEAVETTTIVTTTTTAATTTTKATTKASTASSATTKATTTATTAATTTATTAATTAEPDFPIEKRGAILIYRDTAFEIFGGSNAAAERYAGVVSDYAEALPDVTVYNMVVPSSAAFNLPEKYKSYSNDQRANVSHLYEALSDSVVSVNVFDAMEAHRDEYLYFATDHHWTGLGAYYAYTAFAETAGFEPLAYEDYEKGKLENFKGTLYASSNDANLKEDYVEYCKIPVNHTAYRYTKDAQTTPVQTTVLAEYAKGGNSYSVYLHGDYPRFDIKNLDNSNGRSIMVIKESYGNAFAPYLIPHYENVYVIDLRYFSGSIKSFVEAQEIDEILIIDNVFAANTKHYSDRLSLMLSR